MPAFDLTYQEPTEEGLRFVLQGFHDTGAWWARSIDHESLGCDDGVCTVRFELPPNWSCIHVVGRYVRPGDIEAEPPTLSETSIQSNMINRGCLEGPPLPVSEPSILVNLLIGLLLLLGLAALRFRLHR